MKKKSGLLVCLAVLLAGCGGEGSGAGGDGDVPEPTFAENTGDDAGCEILTTADVSAATGVPVSGLDQTALGDMCSYEWDEGAVTLMGVSVHESIEEATSYHARFTEDVTADQVAAAKERVRGELADREAAGEMSETDEAVGGALVERMPERDIRHRSLPGIGSEAVTDGRGTLRIRYGNATIWVVGKDGEGNDHFEPGVAEEVGRRIVSNLDAS